MCDEIIEVSYALRVNTEYGCGLSFNDDID